MRKAVTIDGKLTVIGWSDQWERWTDLVTGLTYSKKDIASLDTTSEAGRKDEIWAELRCVDENLQSAGDYAENHALEGERNSLLAEIHALGALPAEVTELVIAARIVAFEDQSPEALRRLDQASEAFADRVKWNEG